MAFNVTPLKEYKELSEIKERLQTMDGPRAKVLMELIEDIEGMEKSISQCHRDFLEKAKYEPFQTESDLKDAYLKRLDEIGVMIEEMQQMVDRGQVKLGLSE